MSTIDETAIGPTFEIPDNWSEFDEDSNVYRCIVYLCKEDVGYSAHCPQLLGAVSQGDTKEEAFTNIREALEGIIESFLSDEEKIPWVNEFEIPDEKSAERWILVNV